MDVDVPLAMVRLTALGMVLAYVVRLDADILRRPRHAAGRKGGYRRILWVWGTGYVLYLVHIVVAFAAYHDWSHAAALEHTAQRTAAVTGRPWGGGLWINYALAVWWPLDILWCRQRGIDRLPRWYVVTFHAVVGFLMFNATVIFGPAWWRWAIGVLCLLIAGRGWQRVHRGRETCADGSVSDAVE